MFSYLKQRSYLFVTQATHYLGPAFFLFPSTFLYQSHSSSTMLLIFPSYIYTIHHTYLFIHTGRGWGRCDQLIFLLSEFYVNIYAVCYCWWLLRVMYPSGINIRLWLHEWPPPGCAGNTLHLPPAAPGAARPRHRPDPPWHLRVHVVLLQAATVSIQRDCRELDYFFHIYIPISMLFNSFLLLLYCPFTLFFFLLTNAFFLVCIPKSCSSFHSSFCTALFSCLSFIQTPFFSVLIPESIFIALISLFPHLWEVVSFRVCRASGRWYS